MISDHQYLDGSGSNAVDKSDEEEDDEGESCGPHAVLVCLHVSQDQNICVEVRVAL